MLRPRRPSPSAIQNLLSEARGSEPTYLEIGATRDGQLPAGYRHDAYEIRLEAGEGTFERAISALRAWGAQTGAGVEIVPDGARVGENETVILLLRTGAFWALAPCRVVYVTQERDRFAFAYGTLPGHPEVGEVAFEIDRDENGAVVFHITSFSRTVDPLARLGTPITRHIQKRVTRRYLKAIADRVAATSP